MAKKRSASSPRARLVSASAESIFSKPVGKAQRAVLNRIARSQAAGSKKSDNHVAAISLHFMYYNFARIHQTLRITPAMAAGVTDRCWEVADIVALLEAEEAAYEAKAQEGEERKFSPFGPALGH